MRAACWIALHVAVPLQGTPPELQARHVPTAAGNTTSLHWQWCKSVEKEQKFTLQFNCSGTARAERRKRAQVCAARRFKSQLSSQSQLLRLISTLLTLILLQSQILCNPATTTLPPVHCTDPDLLPQPDEEAKIRSDQQLSTVTCSNKSCSAPWG